MPKSVDLYDNVYGVENGRHLAASRGVDDRVRFEAIDASRTLPFPASSFDAILSNDAMCHIANRLDALRDWHRVLRPGGRIMYTDALIVTEPITAEEIAACSSIGLYIFMPPGENERLIAAAGFTLLAANDVTAAAETIAGRWHDARAAHSVELTAREGEANFAGLQRFLSFVRTVSAERRLSRYCYIAQKRQQA